MPRVGSTSRAMCLLHAQLRRQLADVVVCARHEWNKDVHCGGNVRLALWRNCRWIVGLRLCLVVRVLRHSNAFFFIFAAAKKTAI